MILVRTWRVASSRFAMPVSFRKMNLLTVREWAAPRSRGLKLRVRFRTVELCAPSRRHLGFNRTTLLPTQITSGVVASGHGRRCHKVPTF